MSYIRETIKCPCGKLMNISLGTFGGGMPKKCSHCGKEEKFEGFADGWYADDSGEYSDTFEKELRGEK